MLASGCCRSCRSFGPDANSSLEVVARVRNGRQAIVLGLRHTGGELIGHRAQLDPRRQVPMSALKAAPAGSTSSAAARFRAFFEGRLAALGPPEIITADPPATLRFPSL
jgi:hypothetical protein